MALVTLCGYPSSGKTRRAHELVALFESKIAAASLPLKVVLINDESLNISKSSYGDSRAEKPARATLFSAVTRSLLKDTIVVVDAMNYIKGSRYQMYCNAREVQSRNCTIFVAAPPDSCREWNASKPPETAYAEPTLQNLISRFEEPSSSARWDSPLFTIPHFDPPLFDPSLPLGTDAEGIWTAVSTGDLKPRNLATVVAPPSTASYLTQLESTTSTLISTLLATQSLSPLSGATQLLLPTSPPVRITITVNKPVSMPLCQRLKRQFTKLNMHTANELSVERIAQLFAEYLENGIL